MKKIFILLLFLFSLNTYSQCVQSQTGWIQPPGPYQPGDVVVVDYTLTNWWQLNINWIIAFEINLGVGWSGLQPLITPIGGGTQTGYWLWDLQNTFPSGLNFGPGWRFINTSGFKDP